MYLVGMILSAVVGAGLMYVFDPRGGTRRRALMRDKATSLAHKSSDMVTTAKGIQQDTGNRFRGMLHELKSRRRNEPVDDETLVARVRSAMGRYVTHPGAIVVTVHEGSVTLNGPILANEIDKLVKVVGKVQGVQEVRNQLQIHTNISSVSSLQGSATD